MKFFEEQRESLVGKISKKILKESDKDLTNSELKSQEGAAIFYEIEQKEDQQVVAGRGGRGGGFQRIHHARRFPRRPMRGGRGGRGGRIPPRDRDERQHRPEIAPVEAREEGWNDVEERAQQEDRQERDEREYRMPQREGGEQRPERDERRPRQNNDRREENNDQREENEVDEENRNEAVEVENETETETEWAQQADERQTEDNQIVEEILNDTNKEDKKEEKPQTMEEEKKEKEELRGVQFQHFKEMVLSLFEYLQKQENYRYLEDQNLEIEDNVSNVENNQIVKNATEVSLLLEAERRNVLNEVIDILVFLKNYQSIILLLSTVLQDRLQEIIDNLIKENNLIMSDLLVFYGIYQIFKENVNEQQRKQFTQQEQIYKDKLNFIQNLFIKNQFSKKEFTQFFEKREEFSKNNNKSVNKSYQIIATFISVQSNNIEGIQVKNTEIFLQSVFNSQSWKLSQQSIKKLLNTVVRVPDFYNKISSQEGSIVFTLQSIVQPEEGIVSADCLNLLPSSIISDSSIFTEVQIRNLEKYIAKEQSRISAKQQKSISDYVDEDYKIKFFFDDGLKIKSFLLQDEFISVDVWNLPINLRDQDLEEVLSLNINDQVQSITSKCDSSKKSYYQITFKTKEFAKDFVKVMNEQQIMYLEQYVVISPHTIPELQSINYHYQIKLRIGKNDEIKYLMTQLRNQEYYKKVKSKQMYKQIEKYLSLKSKSGLDSLEKFKTNNLYELQNMISTLKNEQIEEIFDVKFTYEHSFQTSINIQKNIFDFFQDRFSQIKKFDTAHISIRCEEYNKNSKEIQIFLSSSNKAYLKKVLAILTKQLRPIRYTPLQSNKEKEVFFREDFMKNSRKKFTKSYFYTFFNTINMRFEFYTESQFNFTFLNSNNSEQFVSYETPENDIKNVEKQMVQFQTSLNSYSVKSNYFIHPSLQQDFVLYLKQEGVEKYTQNDKLFDVELKLSTYLKINKFIMSQYVKASYLKKNEEIYNNKKVMKQKNNEQTDMPSCVVCYDSDHIFQLSNCSCRSYCRDCLREKIQLDIQQNYTSFTGQIFCPLCSKAPISLKDFSKLFNLYEIQSMMNQWVKCITYNYKNENGQKQFAHCIYPKCQGIIYIPPNLKLKSHSEEMEVEVDKSDSSENEVSNIVCYQCNNAICSSSLVDSKIPYHSAHPPDVKCMDQYKQQRGEMPTNAKYCPTCSQVYFHETGCNHLTCYQCGEHFCSICNLNFGKNQGNIYTHIQECEQKNKKDPTQVQEAAVDAVPEAIPAEAAQVAQEWADQGEWGQVADANATWDEAN